MKAVLVLMLVLSGCSLYFDGDRPPGSGPSDRDGGPHCAPMGYDAGASCICTSGEWHCSTCPGNFRDPEATCTAGTSCEYDSWEHGCSCTCTASGRWDCFSHTVGSNCPTAPPPDAGVDAF